MRLLLLGICTIQILSSATITVCTNGCTYSNLQFALDAAQEGDTIELQPNETYIGTFRIRGRKGSQPLKLTCNTTKLPAGRRMTENYSGLCTIQPNSQYGFMIQSEHFGVLDADTSVNLDNNTIQIEYNHSLPPTTGSNLKCFAHKGASLPYPLLEDTTYLVTRTGLEATFKDPSTGSPIDLVSKGRGRFACSQVDRVQNWTIEHIKIQQTSKMPEGPHDVGLLIGFEGEGPNAMPKNILIRHVVVSGARDRLSQLHNAVWIAAEDVAIEDSWLGLAGEPGYESHVVSLRACKGKCKFHNNAMVNGTIGFLTGGGWFYGNVEEISGVELTKNYIYKEADYFWLTGSGHPMRTGQEGAVYFRSDVDGTSCAVPNKCYEFRSGVWIPTSKPIYRPVSRQEKSAVQFKGCKNCKVEGNIIRNVFAGSDTGNTYCILLVKSSQNGRSDKLEDVIVQNNRCIDTYSGFSMYADGAEFFDTPAPSNIRIRNNSFSGIGNLALSDGTQCWQHHAQIIYIQAGIQSGEVANNTFRTSQSGCAFFPYLFQPASGYQASRVIVQNNLTPVNSSGYGTVFADSVNCSTLAERYIDPNGIKSVGVFGSAGANNDLYANSCIARTWVANEADVKFAGMTSPRLLRDSPFSHENPNAILLGTNARSLGADADELELATTGVLEGFVGSTEGTRKIRR